MHRMGWWWWSVTARHHRGSPASNTVIDSTVNCSSFMDADGDGVLGVPLQGLSVSAVSPPASLAWSLSSLTRKLIYFMAKRRISFLLNFLSGGWVGMSFRSSAKAPFTFCWRHRSRLLVKTRRATFWGWRPGKIHGKVSKSRKPLQKGSCWTPSPILVVTLYKLFPYLSHVTLLVLSALSWERNTLDFSPWPLTFSNVLLIMTWSPLEAIIGKEAKCPGVA